MGIEEAILEHAAALRAVAAAIDKLGHCAVLPGQIENKAAGYEAKAADMKDVETKQFTSGEVAKAAEVKPDADLEQAVSKVEEQAKADAAPLDYTKDVLPVLTKVAQKDKQQLVDMLARYGVKAATKLLPEQFADILADANKFLAD